MLSSLFGAVVAENICILCNSYFRFILTLVLSRWTRILCP